MIPESRQAIGGHALAGVAVGILCPNSRHPLLLGNVQHARSFSFPVLYEIVDIREPKALMRGESSLIAPITAAARKLEQLGVGAIAGSCGSFAYYQRAVAEAVQIPVFMSPMLMVPMLVNSLGSDRKVGIICGAISSINERVYGECGIDEVDRLALTQMTGYPTFDRMMAQATSLEPTELQAEVIDCATQLVAEHPQVGALLLQCSDLPPMAQAVQAATSRPVFDMTRMIHWIASATECRSYA